MYGVGSVLTRAFQGALMQNQLGLDQKYASLRVRSVVGRPASSRSLCSAVGFQAFLFFTIMCFLVYINDDVIFSVLQPLFRSKITWIQRSAWILGVFVFTDILVFAIFVVVFLKGWYSLQYCGVSAFISVTKKLKSRGRPDLKDVPFICFYAYVHMFALCLFFQTKLLNKRWY